MVCRWVTAQDEELRENAESVIEERNKPSLVSAHLVEADEVAGHRPLAVVGALRGRRGRHSPLFPRHHRMHRSQFRSQFRSQSRQLLRFRLWAPRLRGKVYGERRCDPARVRRWGMYVD